MDLNLLRQDIKKICLLIAFQQNLSSGQKTTNFCCYWQILVKNCCRFIAGDLKAFFLFFCFDFLPIDPSNDFCFCKFFVKSLKSEGERLNVKFWSSEMVKIGRGQHNYRCCCHRYSLQSFVNDSVIRSTMDNLRNSKKNLPPSCSHSLFIHIFQFDFGCTSYTMFIIEFLSGEPYRSVFTALTTNLEVLLRRGKNLRFKNISAPQA
jgi:hypothetical protein